MQTVPVENSMEGEEVGVFPAPHPGSDEGEGEEAAAGDRNVKTATAMTMTLITPEYRFYTQAEQCPGRKGQNS